MSSLNNIWLIRHGQSDANVGLWSNTPSEVCLTKLGEEQAHRAAEKIIKAPDLIIVSPLKRARDTAAPIIKRWNETLVETCPIQEFTYLSTIKYSDKTRKERHLAVDEYWELADPYYRDGDDVESFDHFMKRVQHFHTYLQTKKGFIVVVGHGQFFKALIINKINPYEASSNWMIAFRKAETTHPIKNGEIIVF